MKYFSIISVALFLFTFSESFSQSLPTSGDPGTFTLEKKLKDYIDFYPNPSNGSFKLNIKEDGLEEFNVTIFDLKGSIVFEKTFKGLFAGISFDMKLKKPGLYLLKINTEKEQMVEKIIVNP